MKSRDLFSINWSSDPDPTPKSIIGALAWALGLSGGRLGARSKRYAKLNNPALGMVSVVIALVRQGCPKNFILIERTWVFQDVAFLMDCVLN